MFPSGYSISSCNTLGEVDITETVLQTLTCSGITDDYVLWDFTPPGGDRIQIASCTWSTSKCQTTDDDYGVTRTQHGTSILTVKRNHRTKIAGSVRCGGTNGTVTYSPPCNVRVICKYQPLIRLINEFTRSVFCRRLESVNSLVLMFCAFTFPQNEHIMFVHH